MHDIQRELSIVDAWTVHSKRIAIRSGKLRREHRSLAEDHDVTFPKVHRDSLSAAGGRSWIRIYTRHRVDSRVRQFHECEAIGWPLKRLTSKGDDLVHAFRLVAAAGNGMIRKP